MFPKNSAFQQVETERIVEAPLPPYPQPKQATVTIPLEELEEWAFYATNDMSEDLINAIQSRL